MFLVKSDPDTYGLNQLEKDGKTVWDGVRNPTALRHLRSIHKGDHVLVYHSGAEKSVVGLAMAASAPYPDPRHEGLWAFDLQFVARAQNPVTLKDLKADARFRDFDLVRLPRLSTMAVSTHLFGILCQMAGLKS
jgi:predicted RNA-binding protein with PUA-like domain